MLRDLFSLFPAYAGVILTAAQNAANKATFPRIRGGDPYNAHQHTSKGTFSPHTRG